jgi:hypothetical protein
MPPHKGDKPPAADRRSRQKRLEDAGGEAYLPEISAASHLARYLMDVGPVCAAGMGAAPISFSEMRAWQEISGIPLTPWEGRVLRELSQAYLAERNAAGDEPNRPPPWPEGVIGWNRVAAQALRKAVRDQLQE